MFEGVNINKDLYINSFLFRFPHLLAGQGEPGMCFDFPGKCLEEQGIMQAGDRGLQKGLEKACDFLGVGNINILSE